MKLKHILLFVSLCAVAPVAGALLASQILPRVIHAENAPASLEVKLSNEIKTAGFDLEEIRAASVPKEYQDSVNALVACKVATYERGIDTFNLPSGEAAYSGEMTGTQARRFLAIAVAHGCDNDIPHAHKDQEKLSNFLFFNYVAEQE
jgi:hypothetical protein